MNGVHFAGRSQALAKVPALAKVAWSVYRRLADILDWSPGTGLLLHYGVSGQYQQIFLGRTPSVPRLVAAGELPKTTGSVLMHDCYASA